MKLTKKLFSYTSTLILLTSLMVTSCSDTPEYPESSVANSSTDRFKTYDAISLDNVEAVLPEDYMRGFDASMISALEEDGIVFYNEYGKSEDVYSILKKNGVNWIRLRVWNNPTEGIKEGDNSLDRTIDAAKRAKKAGMKLLIDLHFSDTWADPTKQACPNEWKDIATVDEMKKAFYHFTFKVMDSLNDAKATPDMIQLGNECESGILISNVATALKGTITKDPTTNIVDVKNFTDYLNASAKAVRLTAPDTKIMLHCSRGGNSGVVTDFITNTKDIDFDVIGVSYYPFFNSHGTLNELATCISKIKDAGKEAVVAETSFAWCDGYNDSVNNQLWYYSGNDGLRRAANSLVDSDGKLFSEFTTVNVDKEGNPLSDSDIEGKTEGTDYFYCVEPTIQNQANAVRKIIEVSANAGATGIFYWGGDGLTGKTFGSAMENQTFFDFEGKVLPSLSVFNVQGK